MENINWGHIVEVILALLGAFSLIAKLTPTKADDRVLEKLFKFIHFLGLTKKKAIEESKSSGKPPLRLKLIVGAAKFIGLKPTIEIGEVTTPYGTKVKGFKISWKF